MDSFGSKSRSGGSIKTLLWAVSGSFLLGAALVAFIAWRTDFGDGAAGVIREKPVEAGQQLATTEGDPSPTPSASSSAVERVSQAQKAVARVEEQQGGIDQRLAAAEQRISRLDLQAQAAAGNTARAEGLLIAFATRRAIERGAELGYLADQLRLRFGDAMPNAVKTIVSFSRSPVTLDQLVARLEGLGPDVASTKNEPGWSRLWQAVDSLFVVRRESAPSPQPERRLERARLFLESGRTEAAIAEVEQLPGAAKADKWIADAKRYGEAQRALDLIETAAVLEPRRLRDGGGNRVDQPSPANSSATNGN